MSNVKKYILEDLEKLKNKELGMVYKFIRRNIIANIPEENSSPRQGLRDCYNSVKWINVNNRLPISDTPYKTIRLIVHLTNGTVMQASYLQNTKEFLRPSGNKLINSVTHWMPLPEKPTGL